MVAHVWNASNGTWQQEGFKSTAIHYIDSCFEIIVECIGTRFNRQAGNRHTSLEKWYCVYSLQHSDSKRDNEATKKFQTSLCWGLNPGLLLISGKSSPTKLYPRPESLSNMLPRRPKTAWQLLCGHSYLRILKNTVFPFTCFIFSYKKMILNKNLWALWHNV